MWIAAAVAAVAGLLAATLVAVRWADGDEPGSSAEPGFPAGTTTPGPADEDDVRAAVDEISATVEEERGLEFDQSVEVELADDEEFTARLLEDFEEDVDVLRTDEVLFTALGLVEPDVDLPEAMRALLGAGVVGFYDPETDELVVRGTGLSPYVRTTIAHELTHALDDQHFDLDRPEYDEATDEIGFGFTSIVEGSAVRVENAYRDALSDDERDAALEEEMTIGLDADLSAVPFVLIDLITAPYVQGEPLVGALVEDGGREALDAAFAEPPRTSEQVLEPAEYLAGEAAVEVAAPQPPGEVLDEGVAGALLLSVVLADDLGRDEATELVRGWGGDRVVTWRDGDRDCATLALVGDTADDTAALRGAFDGWAAAHRDEGTLDATVQPGAAAGDPFTVQACAG